MDLNYFGGLKYSMKHENISSFLSDFQCANSAWISLKVNSEAAVTQVTSSYFLFCFMVDMLCSQFPMAGGCKKALLAPCQIYIQGFRLIESTDKYRGGWQGDVSPGFHHRRGEGWEYYCTKSVDLMV